jgi:hypothetical protein
MQSRIKMEINGSHNDQAQSSPAIDFAAFVPRLWMVMLAFAVPFFIISADYFEALERTGAIGAFIADILMPATNIAYGAAIGILKSRKI